MSGSGRGKPASKAKIAAAPAGVVPLGTAAASERAARIVQELAGSTAEDRVAGILEEGRARSQAYLEWASIEAAGVLVEEIAYAEQAVAWLRSHQLTLMAQLEDLPAEKPMDARELAEAELAAALVMTRNQASARLDDAGNLSRLPKVMALLRSGLIDQRRAEVIARTMSDHLDHGDDRWARVEAKVVARAPERTAAQLRADVLRAVLSVDPAAAERRREQAIAGREVRMVCPGAWDGQHRGDPGC